MLSYIGIRYLQSSPKVMVRQWSNIVSTVKANTDKIIDKYRRVPIWLASNHLLNQYLHTLELNIHLDAIEFYHHVRYFDISVATSFGFTTSVNDGVIHNGAFYGGNKEIVIGYSSTNRPMELEKNWELLEPVKVLRHNYSNLDYSPIVKRDEGNGGINVILVDFIKLAFQYRGFRLAEEKRIQAGVQSDPDSMSKFLFKYPLANMMYSHIERSILNYVIKDEIDLEFSERKRIDGEYLTKTDAWLALAKEDIITKIKANQWDLGKVFGATPVVFNNDLIQYSHYPEVLMNRQNTWAFLYSSLPIIEYGLKMGGVNYRNSNSTTIQRLGRTLEILENDSVWNKSMMRYIKDRVKDEIYSIEKLL